MHYKNALREFINNAVQFHPEKPSYEWYIDEGINHSFDSITANHYPVTFFVNEARKNSALSMFQLYLISATLSLL